MQVVDDLTNLTWIELNWMDRLGWFVDCVVD